MEYLVWSIEHSSWWNPAERGYTTDKQRAGHYTLGEATQICINANRYLKPGSPPNEAIVPLEESEVSNG